MKKLYILFIGIVGMMSFASCDDSETYADQKKRERAAINSYIAEKNIKVISEADFKAAGEVTNVDENEFVLFESNGVYMQLIRKGCGEKLKDGETATVLCRFDEYNLISNPDTMQLSNNVLAYSSVVDKMSVTNTSGTFTASFDTSSSLMYYAYGSASVPSGWLVPFTYIQVGRPTADGEEIAKVRLIVPHSQGQQYASSNVYPCLYEITYERGR